MISPKVIGVIQSSSRLFNLPAICNTPVADPACPRSAKCKCEHTVWGVPPCQVQSAQCALWSISRCVHIKGFWGWSWRAEIGPDLILKIAPGTQNSLFCCPERLNGAHCLSVGHHWQSESPQHYRVNLETCGPWYVRSEWPWEIFGFLEGFQVFWGIFGWFSEFRKLLDDFQILENFRF